MHHAIGKQLTKEEQKKACGEHEGIILEYVLERNSNLARAVYLAVKHAVDTGALDSQYDQTES